MIQTLECPSCGGPLDYSDDSSPAIRCPFCHNSVVIPKEWRRLKTRPLQPRRSGAAAGMVYVAFVFMALVLGIGGLLITYKSRSARSLPVPATPATPTPTRPLAPKPRAQQPDSGFASLVLTFGGKGIGAGLFTDARSIAVDSAGNTYVGEYTGGRIQVFDAAGKFVTQWMVDPQMPLRGLAADRKGTVYVVQRGLISRYEGASGKPLGQIPYPAGWGFDDITVAADGGLVAAWYKNRDDIVRFNASGQVVQTIRGAISGQTDRAELSTRVAVDGLGNIYAVGRFNGAVFKFTPQGKYVNRFGGGGDMPGLARGLDAIAVDGQGRVYVCSHRGIQVFDPEGQPLGVIKVDGSASGITFNDKNELFVAARTQVHKYVINKS